MFPAPYNGRSFIQSPTYSQNGQESDSFSAHFEHHFKYTTSHTDLRKQMTLKLVKHLNPIGAIETFTKNNFNLCMN